MEPLGPFAVLTSFNLLVCTLCRHACLVDEVAIHLQAKHRDLPVARRGDIVRAIGEYGRRPLIRNQAGLAAYLRLPEAPIEAIPYLAGPFPDGFKCSDCPYVAGQLRSVQEHCRRAHGWVNPRPAGGNTLPPIPHRIVGTIR